MKNNLQEGFIRDAISRGLSSVLNIQNMSTEEQPLSTFEEFKEELYNLPYNEYFISSCSDRLEDESDDVIREELMDGFCQNVAEYLYHKIKNLSSVVKCFYFECRDGLDFHYVFYAPETKLFYDAYNVEGVQKLTDLEFTFRYNKPYKRQSDEFPGRKIRYTEEELRNTMIDVTKEAVAGELYKFSTSNLSYVRQRQKDHVNLNESKKKIVKNDEGKIVPEICPECGSKVGVYIQGEPIYKCSNKKCGKYFGTVPFPKSLKESLIKDEFPTDLKYSKEKGMERLGKKEVKKGNKIEIYYQFGKNGMGITKELEIIGKELQDLAKTYHLYLNNPHFDIADDVYDFKVCGHKRKEIDENLIIIPVGYIIRKIKKLFNIK